MSEAERIVPGWSPATTYKTGDRVIVPVVVRRKWWQLWKPRQWVEERQAQAVQLSDFQNKGSPAPDYSKREASYRIEIED